MADNLGSGMPRLQFQVTDNSVINNPVLKGLTAVWGITQMGKLKTPTIIKSWAEFERVFGGLVSYSDFPLYCKRALEAGGLLKVSRAAHYTDIADAGTAVGVKATGNITVATDEIDVEANNIGSWGNSLVVTVTALPLDATKVKITYQFGNIIGELEIKNAPTQNEIDIFNASQDYVTITAVTNNIPVGTVTCSGGSEDYAGFVAADMKGSVASLTGIHAFDSDKDCVRISPMENNSPDVELYVANWVKTRGDMIAILPLPVGITGTTISDYRNRLNAYTGVDVIDTFHAFGYFGDITVNDPLTSTQKVISSIGDILGRMTNRDNIGYPWFAVAGHEYGQLPNIVNVPYDLGSTALKSVADNLSDIRVNYITDANPYPVIFENNSYQIENTLLKHANVAEMVVNLIRDLKDKVDPYLFQPNNVSTWKEIYREVKALMSHYNANGALQSVTQGNDGEGEGWLYQGDQDIESINDMQINNSNDVDNGIYRFRLFIKPTPAMKYIGIDVTVENSSASFVVQEV